MRQHVLPTLHGLALALGVALGLALTPGEAAGQDPQLTWTTFAPAAGSPLSLFQPLDVTHAGDGTGRLFVNEKGGLIKVVSPSGQVTGIFLDLTGKVSTNSERGLLGLAFAPDYASSGRFYVYYTNAAGSSVVARFRVSPTNPNVADPTSEEVLLTIPQPAANHNGGDIAFGGGGLLYVASGDGGGSNDPGAHGQNASSLLGGILRLDVSAATGYTAAGGGPATWDPHLFAIGLRNPWRMSFDRLTGELYVGDVGQNAREEVDRIAAGDAGNNYGWVCWEGSRDNRSVASAAASNCQGFAAYEPPWLEYDHAVGRSVTGGVVYRGPAHPSLQGFYVYGDFIFGNVWAARDDGVGGIEQYAAVSGGSGTVAGVPSVAGFGEDEAGELYAVSYGGTIYRAQAQAPLPVGFVDVDAEDLGGGTVAVGWRVADERAVDHYVVEFLPQEYARADWVRHVRSTVAARGADTYATRVRGLAPGEYLVRAVAVDADGTVTASRAVGVAVGAPERTRLRYHADGGGFDVEGGTAGDRTQVRDGLGRLLADLRPGDTWRAPRRGRVYFVSVGEHAHRWVAR